jgi:hypothetical protein
VRLYCESQRSRRFGAAADYIDVPTGAAIFPKELYRPPRAWAEAAFNIVHWTEMPAGRALARDGGARPARRRRALVLPARALTPYALVS